MGRVIHNYFTKRTSGLKERAKASNLNKFWTVKVALSKCLIKICQAITSMRAKIKSKICLVCYSSPVIGWLVGWLAG